MEITDAKEIIRAGITWSNWAEEQKEAFKMAYNAIEKVEELQKEIQFHKGYCVRFSDRIKDQQQEIERLQYEASRVEDFIMAFAEKNNRTSFISKWGNKLYSDVDHTLYNMLEDLLIEP